MDKLTVPETREFSDLEARVDAFRVSYQDAGRALMIIRDKVYYRWTSTTFEAYVKERFGYSKGHAYRLIEDYGAVLDTKDVMSPIGDKVLPSPQTESIAREVAKAVSPEKKGGSLGGGE